MGKRTAFNPLGAFEDGGTVTRERVLREVRYWRFAISKRRIVRGNGRAYRMRRGGPSIGSRPSADGSRSSACPLRSCADLT